MWIGELSRRTRVSRRLLRYYEEQGLLAPRRVNSGYRIYTEPDVERVQRIRVLLSAGLNTATIAQVLPCTVDTETGLAAACPALLDDLRREHDRISSAMSDLENTRRALASIITATTRVHAAGR
ncbi:MerR family transcriptional regulator [Nocardia sp. NPDC051832]|uniref:MerR family transcriptional regulator n=1 Tax=Nocardia sp. NPDC051832 TaxID=3155673 RepID=UPI00342FD926